MLKKLLTFIGKMLLWILSIIIFIALLLFLFVTFHPVFGGTPDSISQKKIASSPQFDGKSFKNLYPVNVMTQNRSQEKGEQEFSSWSMIFPVEGKNPKMPLPSLKLDKNNLENNSFAWLGHSTILMRIENQTVLTDPVFHRASPVPFMAGKPFPVQNPTMIEDLPPIDVVLISHDHYDHLDYQAMKKLGNSVGKYIVPLGVKAHLVRWGIEEARIEEKDWYESTNINDTTFIFTPSQHFGGRNINNRNSTLWGGWIIASEETKIFFSGDSGYFDEFKKIGAKYGPFDIAFLENGAYNQAWSQIHMTPEESVQAGQDLNAQKLIPIHWAKFDLALHPWFEPIERFKKHAAEQNMSVATPLIGQIFTIEEAPTQEWWK